MTEWEVSQPSGEGGGPGERSPVSWNFEITFYPWKIREAGRRD